MYFECGDDCLQMLKKSLDIYDLKGAFSPDKGQVFCPRKGAFFTINAKICGGVEKEPCTLNMLENDCVISVLFQPHKERSEKGEEHLNFAKKTVVSRASNQEKMTAFVPLIKGLIKLETEASWGLDKHHQIELTNIVFCLAIFIN